MAVLRWPSTGSWYLGSRGLSNIFKDHAPFVYLWVNFKANNGYVTDNTGDLVPISDRSDITIQKRQSVGGGKFTASYSFKGKKGQFEASVLDGYELDIEFTGAVATTIRAQPRKIEGGDAGGVEVAIQGPEFAPAKHQIHCPGDVARWFDGLVLENEAELKRLCGHFEKQNPDSWIAVGLANTAKDLYSVVAHQGQGLVDTLRIGEGCYEGGWGIGKDFMRALNFVPLFKPLAKGATALRGLRTAVPAAEAVAEEANAVRATASAPVPLPPRPGPLPKLPVPKLAGLAAKDPGGPVCWAVATVNAVQIFKGRVWIPASKLVWKLTGFTVYEGSQMPKSVQVGMLGAFLQEVRGVLGKYGVNLCQLSDFKKNVDSAEKIADLAKARPVGSVILFSVNWIGRQGDKVGHALVAWRAPEGVYIVDRTAEETGQVVRSLSELEHFYSGISTAVLQDAYQLENCSGGFLLQGTKLVFAIGIPTALTVQSIAKANDPGHPPGKVPAR